MNDIIHALELSGDEKKTTSSLLKNRLIRKGKLIIAQAIMAAISLLIIHMDIYTSCRESIIHSYFRSGEFINDWDSDHNVTLVNFQQMYINSTAAIHKFDNFKMIHLCMTEVEEPVYYASMLSAIIIPLLLGIFHFFHSIWSEKNKLGYVTDESIEQLFEKTNSIPMVDSILEVPIGWKYGSKFILIINIVLFLVIIASIAFLLSYRGSDLSLTIWIATVGAVFAIYQIFGDSNEYWVFYFTSSLPSKKNEENTSNSIIVSQPIKKEASPSSETMTSRTSNSTTKPEDELAVEV